MKQDVITVGVLHSDKAGITYKEVKNDLSTYNDLVGGLIDYVNIKDDLGLYCNDEGLLMELEPSLYITSYDNQSNLKITGVIAGDSVLVKHDSCGETISLTDSDKEILDGIIEPGLVFTHSDDSIKIRNTINFG